MFSTILGILVVYTIFLIFLAGAIHNDYPKDADPGKVAMADERIAPVGDVYTDEAAAQQAAAAEPAAEMAAAPAEFDAASTYQAACFACHGTGAAGAPKMEAAAWTDRLGKGEATLVSNAINGINAMPPKGGRADLSDEQVAEIVSYMLSQVQ